MATHTQALLSIQTVIPTSDYLLKVPACESLPSQFYGNSHHLCLIIYLFFFFFANYCLFKVTGLESSPAATGPAAGIHP